MCLLTIGFCLLGHPSTHHRYDIAQHYAYEASRGVQTISMMARAMGGVDHFAALSPSVLLHACAVCAEAEAGAGGGR